MSVKGDLEPVAMVKFNPSRMNPHGDFADEFYYPGDELSISKQRLAQAIEGQQIQKTDRDDDSDNVGLYDVLDTIGNPDQGTCKTHAR